MGKRLVLLVCMVMVLGVVSAPAVLADTIITASQSCRTETLNANTNRHDASKLSVRSDASSAKSWIKFELGGVDVSALKTATLTVTLHEAKAGARNFDISYVNDDCRDNIGWDERTITWNTAPGNNTTDLAGLDTSKTTRVATVNFTDGVAGQAFTVDILSVLQTDTDGIVQFVIHNSNGLLNFATHDHATVAYRPFIDVTLGAGGQARKPYPADGATGVYYKPVFDWTAGKFAATHDVYLGTSFDDVNNAGRSAPLGVLVSQGQDAGTYTPGQLGFSQKYYWRIDEVNAAPDSTIYKGAVWSFTVEAFSTPITGITATASSSATGMSPAATINGSGLTNDLHSTDVAGMWNTATAAATPVWIQYDLGSTYKLDQMWVWNYNTDFEYLLNFGMKDVVVEYSLDGTSWTKLGDYTLAQGTAAAGYAHNTTVSFGGVAAKLVRITASSNYGGASYGLSEVRFYSIPVMAREPSPSNAAQGIDLNPTLTWWAGREAVSHQVYMGTDAGALTLAGTVTSASYAAASLKLGTTYYWRVDEVNAAAAHPTWTGTVWSFTTTDHFVMDDMESYNDTTNRIFDVWIDGYNTTTNGSQIGYATSENGTFNETTNVHGGKQSMPFLFNNSGSITNSEAVRTFSTAQDWTRDGVGAVSLYFRGQTTNVTTVPFWIKLTDQSGKSATVTYGAGTGENVTNLAAAAWAQWSVNLSQFPGVTLTKIKSMTLGLGPGAGTGTVFIDDIQLAAAK
jgi:hypothetical protein